MILVDTSVWTDHLHRTESELVDLLGNGLVVQHPMVTSEIRLGQIRRRSAVLANLELLPPAPVATIVEVDHLVESRRLWGRGLSLVDAHLLASVLLQTGTRLWTRDRALGGVAAEVGVGY